MYMVKISSRVSRERGLLRAVSRCGGSMVKAFDGLRPGKASYGL